MRHALISDSHSSVAHILAWWTLSSHAFFAIPFNTTHYFGPDGPWQAVVVTITYPIVNFTYLHQSQQFFQNINLSPAPGFTGWVPSPQACSNYSTGSCGIRGMLSPLPGHGTPIGEPYFNFVWDTIPHHGTWGWGILGNTTRADLLVAGTHKLNISIAVAEAMSVTYPSGRILGQELGSLGLGSSTARANESFVLDMYDSSLITSDSYGLHVGAASLRYPGSLIVGGYDRGRVIGPVASYSAAAEVASLLDIVIGVETGGTPFNFTNRTGLLQTQVDTPISAPVQVLFDPHIPYINLPGPTISAITSQLPVYFDSNANYWLWDTQSPAYREIVSSPAYLGFVFSDTPTGHRVTVKVPFMLLNLTLEISASGLPSDVPYLPLYENWPPLDEAQADPFLFFGQAFAQAAYLGGNWGKNVSWVAQAPRPGQDRTGLGYLPRDLSATATKLDVEEGESLFRDSWEGYRTPLPMKRTQPNPTQTNETSKHHGLSGGAIAGIVIGCLVGAIAALIAALILLRRRRKRSSKIEERSSVLVENNEQPPSSSELHADNHSSPSSYEMPSERQLYELRGEGPATAEMAERS